MFINMAPFKINMDEKIGFQKFVKNIATDSMDMLKHQKYSYQALIENLRKRDKNIPNLYNILLSYQITNAQQTEGDIKYKTEWTFNGCCAEDIDIQIYDLNDTGSLNVAYDYKTSKYAEKDIEAIHKRILNIINQVIGTKNILLKDIDIVTVEEKEKLLVEFNNTDLEYDENIPFIKYFEEQAEKTPDEIAIVFENKKMTYRELNEKANSLAYLLRENEVTNNTVVGILLERSFEMLISMLAVLKSGGSYIPIASDYPKDRIEYMLEDSEATIILTSQNRRNLADKKLINVKDKKIYEEHKENLENKKKEEIKKEKKQVANIEEHWGEIASSRECQLTDEDLQSIDSRVTKELLGDISIKNCVDARVSFGGTAPSEVRRQIKVGREWLNSLEK